jgi:hypothetical protein
VDRDQVDDIVEIIDDSAHLVQMISAAEAFRRFSWLKDAPVLNASGNYRGMVISAQWKSVYVYSSSVQDLASKAGDALTLLSIADELIKSRQQITAIVNGSDSQTIKAAKLSSQVSGIALRVLAHIAVGTLAGGNWVLRVTRWGNVTYWMNQKQYMQALDSVDNLVTWLNASTTAYLSGGNIYYITTIIAGAT